MIKITRDQSKLLAFVGFNSSDMKELLTLQELPVTKEGLTIGTRNSPTRLS